MAHPSFSELCWAMRSVPQARGIRPVLRTVIKTKWLETWQLAATLLGDEALAPEMMEVAIDRTVNHLVGHLPLEVEEVSLDETSVVFSRFYRQEIRRRRAARTKLSFRGTASDLPSPTSTDSLNAIEDKLDLDALLRETKPELRVALLRRYGSNEQWSEVAANTGTTKEAIRKSCQRELNSIRRRYGTQEFMWTQADLYCRNGGIQRGSA
jgi:hypothetical protein